MRKTKIMIATLLVMVILACAVSSCVGEVYIKTKSEKEETSSKEMATASEKEGTKDEEITKEASSSADQKSSDPEGSITESSPTEEESETNTEEPETTSEPLITDDGKGYIIHTEMIAYDTESIARYLLGKDYTCSDLVDTISDITLKEYISGNKILRSEYDYRLTFSINNVSNYYPEPSLFSRHPSLNYQKAQLACILSEDAETKEGYKEAEESCDAFAEMIEFPYAEKEVYYYDYEFLSEITHKFFATGGPAWHDENKDKVWEEKGPAYWNEDETAFLFIYRMENTDGIPSGTYCDEDLLIILCSPTYGIMQVTFPRKYKATGKEETEIRDFDLVKQEFIVWLAQRGLMETDVEIISKELVYSSYNSDYLKFLKGPNLDLQPFWKISFRTHYTDKELENIFFPEDIFRGDGQSDWYIMYPAYEKSE